MKKSTPQDNFVFKLDTNLIHDINCLLTFLRQSLPLDEFFKKIPSYLLKARLCELEFELKSPKNTPYFLITLKTSNKVSKFELTNNHLSSLGTTITDQKQLITPLLDTKNQRPESSLKDLLTTLIVDANNNNEKIQLDTVLALIKDKTLNLPENKNKQNEINIFFSFLKKLITQENNNYIESGPLIKQAHGMLINLQFSELISWFTSENGTLVLGPTACFSKKYNEIDSLITKLYSYRDISYLADKLATLNYKCLQNLLNINSNEEETLKRIKAIKIIQDFQLEASELIKQSQEKNPLSLEQLNIFHKILNAIAKLVPKFIIKKQTRVHFFQQYAPQKEILLEIEKSIQPFLSNR
ncbi:MAG: hypothetical protein RLY40_153 [Pseudomonadota bacterium]|jgi:hypothetical protein